MKLLKTFLATTSAILILTGCDTFPLSSQGRELEKQKAVEYNEAWQAMEKVLKQYFVVKTRHHLAGQIIAITAPSSAAIMKTRQKIVGELIDKRGWHEVEVRVMNQIEISQVDSFSDRQSNYQWKTIDFDEILEARLVQEIYRELKGPKEARVAPQPSAENASARRYPRTPLPRIDRSNISEPGPVDSRQGASSHLAFVNRKVSIKDPFTRALILGDMHFKEGNYRGAQEQYLIAQKREAASPVPLFAIGHTSFALGKYEAAAAAIRLGMKNHRGWAKVKMDRRNFYPKADDFLEQILTLEKWSRENSENPEGHFLLGYNYYFSGRPSLALKAFKKALELNSKDGQAKEFIKLLDSEQVI